MDMAMPPSLHTTTQHETCAAHADDIAVTVSSKFLAVSDAAKSKGGNKAGNDNASTTVLLACQIIMMQNQR
jgi:hypothetical protein